MPELTLKEALVPPGAPLPPGRSRGAPEQRRDRAYFIRPRHKVRMELPSQPRLPRYKYQHTHNLTKAKVCRPGSPLPSHRRLSHWKGFDTTARPLF